MGTEIFTRYRNDLIAMLFILLLGGIIQHAYMKEFPSFIHAWAQNDRYAMAIAFTENGMDLFHPETMIYNKQFPDWWQTASESTVTSVDFPIHEYAVAAWMKLFHTTAPWVFRYWTLLLSFFGMFFLYRTALLLSRDFLKSLLVVGIAMTAPVYAYYFNGFLPGIPAFAFGVFGIWAYLKHVKGDRLKFFFIAMAAITLSMLMRTTFVIEWVAVLCYELLRVIRRQTSLSGKWCGVLVPLLLFTGYYLWNAHLRKQYGTLFLSELLPPHGMDEARSLLKDTWDNWILEYFQPVHYVLMLLIFLGAAVSGIRRHRLPGDILLLPLIYLFGCLLFLIAMMFQFPHHDYYFIDTFFLPLLLLLCIGLGEIPCPDARGIRIAAIIVLTAVCGYMLCKVHQTQVERRWTEDRAYLCYRHFIGSAAYLDSLGIARDARLLTLYAYPQNAPFIQMERKGFTVMEHKTELVEAALQFPFDYIIIENEVVRHFFEERKACIGRLERLADNGQICVCTLADSIVSPDYETFFK